VLIAIVVILAFVLNLLVLQDRDGTTMVAVADEALAAGATIEPDVVRLVPIDSGFAGLPDLVTEPELVSKEGWVLSRSLAAGGLIAETVLVQPGPGSGLRTMSLPVSIEHAAGGDLGAGDRVDVISVVDGAADFIAVDLEVVTASQIPSGSIGSSSGYHVVVNVTVQDALELAAALDSGSIEVLRSTGAIAIGEAGDDAP
jgi:Flp pilus assembly protein CpaB